MNKNLQHDFKSGQIPFCQICNSKNLFEFLDLGYQPLANTFLSKKNQKNNPVTLYPIKVVKCRKCGLVQLDHIVNQSEVYHNEYPYIPSITGVVNDEQFEFANTCYKKLKLKKNDLVVDIGSNDGNLLRHFKNLGCRVVGIEPTDTYKLANKNKIKTYKSFFDKKISNFIKKKHGKAKLITATNVFAHMSSLGSVMTGITNLLDKESFFVFENHYLGNVIKNLQYDTFYHEHLRTYSAMPLKFLFDSYKLNFFDAYKVSRYGGSLRCFVSNLNIQPSKNLKKIYQNEKKLYSNDEIFNNFSEKIYKVSNNLQEIIHKINNKKQSIVGKACPARAVVLLSYNNINQNKIPYIAEQKTSLKLDLTIPYLNIPIKNSKIFLKDKPDYILLLAWHLKNPIIKKWRDLGLKSKFIVPLPKVEIL